MSELDKENACIHTLISQQHWDQFQFKSMIIVFQKIHYGNEAYTCQKRDANAMLFLKISFRSRIKMLKVIFEFMNGNYSHNDFAECIILVHILILNFLFAIYIYFK